MPVPRWRSRSPCLAAALAPYWTAATLITRAAGASGLLGIASRWTARDVSSSIEHIPTRPAIEDVAKWMTARGDLYGADRIGVMGVSFSGGLSIVASGRPSIRDQIAYILSVGGHGNLPCVLR